jgi:AraC family transcriptional regulator, transcriptional activator of pobA
MNLSMTAIPFYGLYGEPIKRTELEFVHIEEIADRSRDRNWIIKIHRHSKLFQIVYLKKGEMEVNLDGIERHISGESIVTIPSGIAHGFKFQPNSEGSVLSFNTSMLFSSMTMNNPDDLHRLTIAPHIISCLLDDHYLMQFTSFISHLKTEFKKLDSGRNDALEWLSKLALLCIARLQRQNQAIEDGGIDSTTLHKFWLLLETHYKDHWTVSAYAENLHISLSTLNRLCRKCLGKGAKMLLQERLLIEARRRLEYTQQTSTEIAFSLGFKDQAYFSRYFKKHMSVTPGIYRAEKL